MRCYLFREAASYKLESEAKQGGEGKGGGGGLGRQLRAHSCWDNLPPEGRGDSHMKGSRMFVVSLSGVNYGFWSHFVCSGQKAIIFSHEGLVYGCGLF